MAVEAVAPSVVSIVTETSQMSFFGFSQTSSSDGSGVVIEQSGIVLTNAHVVEQSHRVQVSFSNGDSYDAKLLGIASELDLAILQIQGKGPFPSVKIGTSSRAMLGERVIAIGNPFGLGHTVTTGILLLSIVLLKRKNVSIKNFCKPMPVSTEILVVHCLI